MIIPLMCLLRKRRLLTVIQFNIISQQLFGFKPTHPDTARDVNDELNRRGIGRLSYNDLNQLCNRLAKQRVYYAYNTRQLIP